jgi:hypothetical protein
MNKGRVWALYWCQYQLIMGKAYVCQEGTVSMESGLAFGERVESIKAGAVGSGVAAIAFGGMAALQYWGSPALLIGPVNLANGAIAGMLPIAPFVLSAGVSGSIAGVSGFLFGVTYRYIVRQDRNPHLKSGAVGAFGLVRGLAQVDGQVQSGVDVLPGAIALGESLLLFALCRVVLEVGLRRGWLKPFGDGDTA